MLKPAALNWVNEMIGGPYIAFVSGRFVVVDIDENGTVGTGIGDKRITYASGADTYVWCLAHVQAEDLPRVKRLFESGTGESGLGSAGGYPLGRIDQAAEARS